MESDSTGPSGGREPQRPHLERDREGSLGWSIRRAPRDLSRAGRGWKKALAGPLGVSASFTRTGSSRSQRATGKVEGPVTAARESGGCMSSSAKVWGKWNFSPL